MHITFAQTGEIRQHVISTCTNNKYRTVDLGGTVNGWSKSVVDLTCDINARGPGNMAIDLCSESDWGKLFEMTGLLGKFDYAICTHTLEDIYAPFVTLKNLPLIAKRGVISMPSIYTELSRIEHPDYLGYIHHRWIFHHENNGILVIPKLGFLEALCQKNIFLPQKQDIMYEWEDTIDYSIFMNNYLGPNTQTVIEKYKQLIRNL